MKDTITQQLDDKDIKCVDILKRVGFGTSAAKTVVAMVSGKKTQRELTMCTGENQSSISVTLKKLVKADYVDVSELLHTEEKGRPKSEYILKSWDDIVDKIERQVIRDFEEKTIEINRLKELSQR